MPNTPQAFLTAEDVDSITGVLGQCGVLSSNEAVRSVGPAGPGNMNLVLRIRTTQRTLILKQSRPWVEKYPNIAAPVNRAHAEIGFYQTVNRLPARCGIRPRDSMPTMLGFDRDSHLIVLEDLGPTSDFGRVYASQDHRELPLAAACRWLAALHDQTSLLPTSDFNGGRRAVGCDALRDLNHQHLFKIPFDAARDEDLEEICVGLASVAAGVRAKPGLLERISELGQQYLNPRRDCLLHGDYYPGSWLDARGGFQVIDAEFCFEGPREFDLAICAAHAILAGGDSAVIDQVIRRYQNSTEHAVQLDGVLLRQWAGVEILRRVLGVAQLPIPGDLPIRRRLCDVADGLMKIRPPSDPQT